MGMKNPLVIFTVLLLAAQAFATGPLLQITNYSTTPSEVYPGTFGYLQVTLANKGDADATSVSAHYDIDGVSQTLTISDIGTGSSGQASVPFKISQSSAGSIQVLDVTVFYSYTSGSGLSSKKTAISLPITVKQYRPLLVETKAADLSIAPGEKVALDIELKNTGGVVNNLVISVPGNSSFSIDGATQKSVGTIPRNESVTAQLTLVSSSDTKTGTYGVPLIFSYQDSLRQPTEETLYVGPITVLSSSTQYRVELVPLTPVEIGSEARFLLRLTNAGSSSLSGTLDINSTSVFTPIGMQKIYFDDVPAGTTVERNVTLGVLSSQSAGYYTLPITLSPNSGQSVAYGIGIAVDATPEITVTLDSSGSIPQVQISNTGNSQIRSVYVTAKPAGATSASENFVGTLNVDDFAAVALPSDSAGKSIEVTISYRDTNNEQHTISKTLQPVAGSSSFSQQSGRTQASATGSSTGTNLSRQRQGGMFGFGSSGNGLDPAVLIGGAVVVIVVGYFGYRKFFAGKKGKQKPLEMLAQLRKEKK